MGAPAFRKAEPTLGWICLSRAWARLYRKQKHKKPRFRGIFRSLQLLGDQSPRVSSEALPPAAVVFTVTVFSVAKRSR